MTELGNGFGRTFCGDDELLGASLFPHIREDEKIQA